MFRFEVLILKAEKVIVIIVCFLSHKRVYSILFYLGVTIIR